MKLSKSGVAHFAGVTDLADVDLDAPAISVNRRSQLVQIRFKGQDGSSKYNYCISLTLDECLRMHSRIFGELMTNESVISKDLNG